MKISMLLKYLELVCKLFCNFLIKYIAKIYKPTNMITAITQSRLKFWNECLHMLPRATRRDNVIQWKLYLARCDAMFSPSSFVPWKAKPGHVAYVFRNIFHLHQYLTDSHGQTYKNSFLCFWRNKGITYPITNNEGLQGSRILPTTQIMYRKHNAFIPTVKEMNFCFNIFNKVNTMSQMIYLPFES